jgi:hypothetical protein
MCQSIQSAICFDKLKHLIEVHGIPVENLYNIDEKGCQQGGGKKGSSQKYLYSCKMRARYKYHSANIELITIIEYICADGTAFSPGFVFEGQQYDPEWFKTDHRITYAYCSSLQWHLLMKCY